MTSSSKRQSSNLRKPSCERDLSSSADPAPRAYRAGHTAAGGSLRMDEAAFAALDALVALRRRFADDPFAGPLRCDHVFPLGLDEPARARRSPPARHRAGWRQRLAARNRRPRRARDYRRVLDWNDSRELHRGAEAPTGALGENRRLRGGRVPADAAAGPDCVLREPGNSLAPPHLADLVLTSRSRPLRHRWGRLSDASRDLRARYRRHRAQYRRGDRDVRRHLLRHPASDEHPAEQLEPRDQQVPAERGGPAALLAHTRREQLLARSGRVAVRRLLRADPRDRCRPAGSSRHVGGLGETTSDVPPGLLDQVAEQLRVRDAGRWIDVDRAVEDRARSRRVDQRKASTGAELDSAGGLTAGLRVLAIDGDVAATRSLNPPRERDRAVVARLRAQADVNRQRATAEPREAVGPRQEHVLRAAMRYGRQAGQATVQLAAAAAGDRSGQDGVGCRKRA